MVNDSRDCNPIYFECSCSGFRHVLRFVLDLDEHDPEILVEVLLNSFKPWYKRAWNALLYVFGMKKTFGHFDCTLLKLNDVVKLKKLCEEFIKHSEKISLFNHLLPAETSDMSKAQIKK